jgi:hypothetical protein
MASRPEHARILPVAEAAGRSLAAVSYELWAIHVPVETEECGTR